MGSDRGIEFGKLLYCRKIMRPLFPLKRKAEREMLPFISHQEMRVSSVRNPKENGPR